MGSFKATHFPKSLCKRLHLLCNTYTMTIRMETFHLVFYLQTYMGVEKW